MGECHRTTDDTTTMVRNFADSMFEAFDRRPHTARGPYQDRLDYANDLARQQEARRQQIRQHQSRQRVPQTQRGWRGSPLSFTAPRNMDELMNHREQQRRHSELAAAARQLRDYGFHDEQAVTEALLKHGCDVKACVKHLMQREREDGGSVSSSDSQSSAPAHSSHTEASSSSESPDDSSDARKASSEARTESHRSESEASSAASSTTSSGAGSASHGTPEDEAAIAECKSRTEAIHTEMEALAAKYEPQVLRQEWHKCKMHVSGVPLDLVGYEEALLKLQMTLDMLGCQTATWTEASDEARQEMRGLRRAQVRAIQARLDAIDGTRGWWLNHAAEHEE